MNSVDKIQIHQIPETAAWLLSRNRYVEAEKSLRWVRGWASSEAVAQEFNDMKRHSDRSKSCATCLKQDLKCNHPLPSLIEKCAELKRKATFQPLFIVLSMFVLATFASLSSMQPFYMQIFKAYNSPIAPDKVLAIMSVLKIAGTIFLLLLVRFTGKRRILLFCVAIIVVCIATLAWYGVTYLPTGYTSFNQINHDQFELENKTLTYIPICCLLLISFLGPCSVEKIPWMLLSEIFPFK